MNNELKDTIKMAGWYELECRDKDGNLKWKDTVKNAVVTVGKAQVALLIGDAAAVPFTYIAVGTSNSAVTAGQTALVAEIVDSGLARVAGTVSRVSTTTTNDTYQITTSFIVSATKAIEELGIFSASSAGVMLSRALTSTRTVTSTDVFSVTYKLQFS